MPAAKLNLAIDQGATFKHVMSLKAGSATSPAMDLTGYKARMQVRPELASDEVLIELTTENGRITITPSIGELMLKLTPAETTALSFSKAVYDLELESLNGDVTRLLQGNVSLSRQVTR
jgi:hypothetical protein